MQYINTLSLALALSATTLAQTFSDCDPTKKAGCPTKPGLATQEYSVDFRTGAASLADWTTTSGTIGSVADGAEFKIEKLGDGPTIQSNFYLFFGYVEVVMKAAPGAGIVSSFVMESDDLDEIDWEWIGSDTARAQSNYFGKGNTTTYDRGQFHPVTTPEATFQKYAVNWTQETTTWLVNDQPVRTLNFADAVGGQNYPQTPMNVRLGNWVAGDPKNAPGTIEWAGGLADFTKGPFSMFVQSVKVVNYNPGASYKYGDQTGSWKSIQVEGAPATAPVEAHQSSSPDGPGGSKSHSEAAMATSAAAQASAVTNSTGVYGGDTAAAAATTTNEGGAAPSKSCTTLSGTSAAATAAAASGNAGNANAGGLPSTVSIGLGGSQPTGASVSNSTGSSGSNGGGIIAAGSGSNATLPTYTVKPGGAAASGGNGANAVPTVLTTTPSGFTNPAQTSFSLGAQQNGTFTSTGGPLQATTNAGSRLRLSGVAAVGMLGAGMALF